MIDEGKWERVAYSDDPQRCQNSSPNIGQCPYKAVPGSKKCPRHSAKEEAVEARQELSGYRFNRYQERVKNFTENSHLKTLTAEVGVLRMVLEEIVNNCQGPLELVAYAGKIGDTIIKIQGLIKTCHHLDLSLGSMLSKDKIMLVGNKMVEICTKYIKDPDILEEIGNSLIDIILNG